MSNLRDYQQRAVDAIEGSLATGGNPLVVLATGCHRIGQPVLMHDMSTKAVEDVIVGDRLMGPDSEPREVLQLCRGRGPMVEIAPNKGEPFVVNDEHILTLVRSPMTAGDARGGEVVDICVRDLGLLSAGERRHLMLLRKPVLCGHSRPLPLPPYFLGLMLGNGGMTATVNVSTAEPEVIEYVTGFIGSNPQLGVGCRIIEYSACSQIFFPSVVGGSATSELRAILRDLGLLGKSAGGKFVPPDYKTASMRSRLELIAGMVDTDGYADRDGLIQYTTKSDSLAADFVFLCRSVGLGVTASRKLARWRDKSALYWSVTVRGKTGVIPCLVARRRTGRMVSVKDPLRTGFSVNPLGEEDYYGFRIDGDGRFLLGDFTVTHNTGKTHIASHVVDRWKYRNPLRPRVLFLAGAREIVQQNAATLERVTGEQVGVEMGDSIASGHFEWGQRIVCGSVQTLRKAARNLKFNPEDFGLVICDECHHAEAAGYAHVFNRFHHAQRVGLTATPDRHDKKTLARWFDTVAFEYGIVDGISDGWLVPITQRLVTLTNVSFDDIRTLRKDLDPVELADAMVGEGPLHGVVRSLMEYVGNRSTVVFASSVGHGHLLAELLNRPGYGRPGCAWSADCHTDKTVRAERLAAYERGEFQFLVNFGLFTEGWDSTRTSAIAVARPTKSRSLFCLDGETEILTKAGWRGMGGVCVGDEVAAYLQDDCSIEWQQASGVVVRLADQAEGMFGIESPRVSIRVSGGHRMLISDRRSGRRSVVTARGLAGRRSEYLLPVSGIQESGGVPLTDDELRFVGWVLTDGSISKRTGGISITQASSQQWNSNIVSMLSGCGFKYTAKEIVRDTQFASNHKLMLYTISKGRPRGDRKHLRGWGDLDGYVGKDISPLLGEMDDRQLSVMLEAMHLANGSKQLGQSWTRRSWHIGTGSESLANNLQSLCLRRGFRCSVSVCNYNKKPYYMLHIKRQQFAFIGGASAGDRPVFGEVAQSPGEKVWCVEVPSGAIVTRRHGKPAILGNCQMVGRGTRICPQCIGLDDACPRCGGKKDLLVLGYTPETTKHKLITTVDLLLPPGPAAEAVAKRLPKEKAPLDIRKAAAEEAERMELERQQALERMVARAEYEARFVDPFAASADLFDQPANAIKIPSKAPASAKAKKFLRKHGVDIRGLTKADANMLIRDFHRRVKEQLWTFKQESLLLRHGWTGGEISKRQASDVIEQIKNSGWRMLA